MSSFDEFWFEREKSLKTGKVWLRNGMVQWCPHAREPIDDPLGVRETIAEGVMEGGSGAVQIRC